jgi:DNA-directed RNA polymerase subunit H (RpoH/RPB5)
VFILGRKKKETTTDSKTEKKIISKKPTDSKKIKLEIVKPKKVTKSETKEKVVKTRRPKKRARKVKDEVTHKYIPKQIILDEDGIQELINKNINIEKLPSISISDSGIQHLEVNAGNIIKIFRKNPLLGEIIYYRRIVKD